MVKLIDMSSIYAEIGSMFVLIMSLAVFCLAMVGLEKVLRSKAFTIALCWIWRLPWRVISLVILIVGIYFLKQI